MAKILISPPMSIDASIANATAGSVLFAGTNGVLQQDNSNFFWDDSNNRLGIGTASPTERLDLSTGSAATSGGFFEVTQTRLDSRKTDFASNNANNLIYGSNTGGSGVDPFDVLGNLIIQPRTTQARKIVFATAATGGGAVTSKVEISSGGNLAVSAGNLSVFGYIQGTTGNGFLDLRGDSGATSGMRIDDDGNVGIGSTAPGRSLTIANSTASLHLALLRSVASGNLGSGANAGTIAFGAADNSTFAERVGATINAIAAETYSSTAFGTHLTLATTPVTTTTPVERMRIDSQGNVGINTTGSAHSLDVVGTSSGAVLNILHLRNNATAANTGAALVFGNTTADGDSGVEGIISVIRTNTPNSADADMVFSNRRSSSNTETLRLNSLGTTVFGAAARLKGYTVATLPAGVQGDTAFVTDATAPAFLTAIVGGGAVVTPAFYDGTNWVAV